MAPAASTTTPTPPALPSAQQNALDPGRGHRSGARRGQVSFNSRGGGRGRGSQPPRPHDAPHRRGQHHHSPLASRPAPPRPPAEDLGGGGASGHRSTKGAAPTIGEGEGLPKGKAQAEDEDEDVEADVCFICASTVVHNSIAPCNHRTCHICALRLRALYKTRACAHCRVSSIHSPPCIAQMLTDIYRQKQHTSSSPTTPPNALRILLKTNSSKGTRPWASSTLRRISTPTPSYYSATIAQIMTVTLPAGGGPIYIDT